MRKLCALPRRYSMSLCCCNRLRLWGCAGQLVYIPVFSLVQVHHERIAHMWHLFHFRRGEDHLWTSRWRNGQRQVLFSGVDGLLRRGCLFCHCRLLCAGTCSKSLAERERGGFGGCYVQVDRYNCLPTSSRWAWIRSPVGCVKHQSVSKLSIGTNASATIILAWKANCGSALERCRRPFSESWRVILFVRLNRHPWSSARGNACRTEFITAISKSREIRVGWKVAISFL